MRNCVLIFAIFWSAYTQLSAQSEGLYSTLSHSFMLDNPAAMGIDGRHHLFLGAYRKWMKLDDAPQTLFLSSSHPLLSRALGIGGTFVYDKAGLINTLRMNLNASVHLTPGSLHQFSLGASARYQTLMFGIPNVEDPFLVEVASAQNINLGVGFNYRMSLDKKDGTYFNLYAALPQFPATLDLKNTRAAGTSTPLQYNMGKDLLVQGNLRLKLSESNYFTPSIRYQTQLSAGAFSKSQFVDLGLGLSFMKETFKVRLGVRSGQASLVYGGVGFLFGKKTSANLFIEPTGPFGPSAAFDGEMVFGTESDSDTTNKVKTKKTKKINCWEELPCIKERLSLAGIGTKFNVSLSSNANSTYSFVNYSFSERINAYINYFNHADFISQIPLPTLFNEIEALNLGEIQEAEDVEIEQLTFHVKVKNKLEGNSYETYEGNNFVVRYWQSGGLEKSDLIRGNQDLTEGQLAATKIYFLAEKFRATVPSLKNANIRMEVVHDPGITDNRKVEIILVVKHPGK